MVIRRPVLLQYPIDHETGEDTLIASHRRVQKSRGAGPTAPGACSVSVETDHALDSLFGCIFYGKPVSAFSENAPAAVSA
jgi:hypothetical protein